MARVIFAIFCITCTLFTASKTAPNQGGHEIAEDGIEESTMATVMEMLMFKSICQKKSEFKAGFKKWLSCKQCLDKNINMEQLILDFGNSSVFPESRQAFGGTYCPAFNESFACFDYLAEGLAMCGYDNLEVGKKMNKRIIQNIINLVCENDGKFLIELDRSELNKCVDIFLANVTQCEPSRSFDSIPFAELGSPGCREIKRVRTCSQELIMSSCSSMAAFELLDVTLQPILETAKCNKMEEPLNIGLDQAGTIQTTTTIADEEGMRI